ncbi:MAG: DUF2127 domain-containing protein [Patescibacteria group bacterium]|nr:DUF2127 domain-containing protein [Patescibacteria group bacterium]MDE1966091.1 DUF2127 domain-containing protein [Patescibacteria group bacterium]
MRVPFFKFREQGIWDFFLISLFIKAVDSSLEFIGGLLLLFVNTQAILATIISLTDSELNEDPHDIIAGTIHAAAQSVSVSGADFAAVYLISHGIIKLALIAGVLSGHRLAYPAFIGVMSLLVVYQMYRYSLGHSPWLLVISFFDVIVILLAFHEYRYRFAKARPVSE